MTKDEALKLALEALEALEADPLEMVADVDGHMVFLKDKAITAIKEALAQPEQDNTYAYASSLAKTIWQKHYIKESPKFALLDTTEGVLTQIDNMTCGLVREKPAQPEQEPVAWMDEYGDVLSASVVSGKGLRNIPLYTTPPQRTERPVDCERCNRLEEQAYDLVGKLRVANIKLSMLLPRTWAGLMRGVRVEGDTVVIKVKNGNDAARKLCGALIEEMNK